MTRPEIVTLEDGTLLVPVNWDGTLLTYAWVDASDRKIVAHIPWHAQGRKYASSARGLMHRIILGLTPGVGVGHHVNEDTFDNRRTNLLACRDALHHGDQPHPRRNLLSGRLVLPQPHERELLLERLGLEDRARRLNDEYRLGFAA